MNKIKEIKEHVGSLIKERGLSYNALSLKYGKSGTYLHKFVTAKSPQRLDETFRKNLAEELNVPEQELTDIDLSSPSFQPPFITAASALYDKLSDVTKKLTTKNTTAIDIIDTTDNLDNRIGSWMLPQTIFNSIANTNGNTIKMFQATGDTMAETIRDGDWVLVDTSNKTLLSDGIYLIKMASGLAIRRIQSGLKDIVIKSDNNHYSDITAQLDDIEIIGRIIYILNAKKV